MTTSLKLISRPSEERGRADHGWLKTFHTFSFAQYQNSKHQGYGPLRVINEDRVAPTKGFGTHPHAGFEIFTYVISGILEHKDSMGNIERLGRGSLQLTSAGTGITHSEIAPGPDPVHLLQIWAIPRIRNLEPQYYTREFSDNEKRNKFVPVVAPARSEGVSSLREAKGPAPIQCQLTMYAALIEKGEKVEQVVKGKKAYVQVAQTSGYNPGRSRGATLRLCGNAETLELREGDGAYIALFGSGEATLVAENLGNETAEVLLFDME